MVLPDNLSLKFSAVQTRHLALEVLVRQYELSSPVAVSLRIARNREPMPIPGHWRVSMQVSLSARTAEGQDVFHAACTKEMVAMFEHATEQVQEELLRTRVPDYLYPYIRAELQLALTNAGYVNVMLPPLNRVVTALREDALPDPA